jgi:hypothetical protein
VRFALWISLAIVVSAAAFVALHSRLPAASERRGSVPSSAWSARSAVPRAMPGLTTTGVGEVLVRWRRGDSSGPIALARSTAILAWGGRSHPLVRASSCHGGLSSRAPRST